jgi:hypothetical protein
MARHRRLCRLAALTVATVQMMAFLVWSAEARPSQDYLQCKRKHRLDQPLRGSEPSWWRDGMKQRRNPWPRAFRGTPGNILPFTSQHREEQYAYNTFFFQQSE